MGAAVHWILVVVTTVVLGVKAGTKVEVKVEAKAKGKAKGKGGFIGGIFEAVGEFAKCLCCLMVTGPILIIIGIYFFQLSLQDPRSKMVGEYNSVVDTWNSGPGADGSFKELKIQAKLTTNRQTQLGLTKQEVTVLLGKVAPEDIGDSSQNADETFTAVIDPYYYATERDDKTINKVYPSYDGGDGNNGQGSSVTLSFEGSGVGTSSSTTFYPVVSFDVPYSWYCSSSNSGSSRSRRRSSSSSSSSSSCSNTCNNPSASNSNSAVNSCPTWSTSSGGEWIDNGDCYESSSTTKRATGCCIQKWGATKACFQSQVVTPKSKVNIQTTPCTTNKGQVTSQDKTIQYGVMGSTSWGIGMEISVRNSKDPFIAVSKMTGGCSSGTSSSTPRYTTDSTTSTASRCFGATAAELRSYASIFFLFGALFSVFPAGVMYFLFKKANGNGNNNNKKRFKVF